MVDSRLVEAIAGLETVAAQVVGEGSVLRQIAAGGWDEHVQSSDQALMAEVVLGAQEYLRQVPRTLDSFQGDCDCSQSLIVNENALQSRLPFNRKERYFTGTVLPGIIAADGFRHLGMFLDLCGLPARVKPGLDGCQDVQFFTEYNFAESVSPAVAQQRWKDWPLGGDTPDVVLTGPDWLLAVEAKMYDKPNPAALGQQLSRQAELVSYWASSLHLDSDRVRHVLLVPDQLTATATGLGHPVVTWQQVLDAYRRVGPVYWVGVLEHALNAYSDLAAKKEWTFGANRNGFRTGQQIVDGTDLTDGSGGVFTWMGRAGGLAGANLADDVLTDAWRSRRYEVRYEPLLGNPNWFPIEDFRKWIAQAFLPG